MSSEVDLTALTPLVETLVSTRDGVLCDRVLLEALRTCTGAQGAALWRRLAGPEPGWRAVLEIGCLATLPAPERVRAVVEGRLDGRLGELQRVFGPLDPPHLLAADPDREAALDARPALAVALGGPFDEGAEIDLAEALFVLFAHVEALRPDLAGPTAALPHARPAAPAPEQPGSSAESRRIEVNGLAHDLRSILCSLTAASELLASFASELDPLETEHACGVLERDFRRLGRLLARAATGRETGPHQASHETIHDVLTVERVLFARAGVEIEGDIESTGAWKSLDEVDLRRLLQNLLCNALDSCMAIRASTPERGRKVRIEWHATANGVLLAVEDDGGGLPDVDPRTLFADGVTLGKERGTGTGLAVVHRIAVRLGGVCRAQRVMRGGARFEVELPRP